MKKLYILAASLLMLGSCTTDDMPILTSRTAEIEQPQHITIKPEPIAEPIVKPAEPISEPIQEPTPEPVTNTIPDWLIGTYQSRFFPESEYSTITADEIILKLNADFGAPDFFLLTSEMTITENEDFISVSYLNEFELQFWKSDTPATTDIKIVYITSTGQTLHYGWFKRI